MTDTKVLFCWSGGGYPALDVHVGIWQALAANGVFANANAGTSAGAAIAALNSEGYSADLAEQVVRDLGDADLRSERLAWKLRVPWISWFLGHRPIEALLDAHLPRDFSELQKPLSVFVTNNDTGASLEIHQGDPRTAVLASLSISGVYPAVGHWSDGGTTANLPLPAHWHTYDEVWLLVARRPLDYARRQGSMLSRLIWNLDLLAEDQVRDTIALAQRCMPGRVRVLRPPLPAPRGALRLDHTLIDMAFLWANQEIKTIRRQAAPQAES